MPAGETAHLQPVNLSPSLPQTMDKGNDKTSLRWQLLLECDAMARYAFSSGLKVPPELMPSLALVEAKMKEEPGAASGSLAEIGQVHVQLASLVAPAMPRTIYLLHSDKARNSWLSILGPLPTVRRLMLASLFFTLIFIFSSLSPYINVLTMRLDIYRMDGLLLVNVLVFLMSAAGIGATFQALFTAHSCIANGTYDPRYESSFWTQISLGVIAGLVLSQVIPLGPENMHGIVSLSSNDLENYFDNFFSQTSGSSMTVLLSSLSAAETAKSISEAITRTEGPMNSAATFGMASSISSKPLLALVGGFSATLVYTVMQRFVTAVESLFTANGAESRAERERQIRDIVAEKLGTHGQLKTPLSTSKSPALTSQVVSLSPTAQPQQGEKTDS